MLIDEDEVLQTDYISNLIATLNGNNPDSKKIQVGIYEIGHFRSSAFLAGYEHYPHSLSIDCYGICDNYEQILSASPELVNSNRKFVITISPIFKDNQSEEGGWRWHKWGEYIGIQQPTCEYLYDELIIEKIFVYHIYEKLG